MSKQEKNAASVELLDLATPRLYRRNLFRVLGLPITATSADVRRQQKRLEMQRKLGLASSEANKGPLALDPPPTDEEIRAAMDRLNDPQTRLFDEVFWFWPTNGDPSADPALKALEHGQVKQASEIWSRQTKQHGKAQIAAHNLAVLNHLAALDCELRLTSGNLDKKQTDRLAALWSHAFAQWQEVLKAEDFWSVVKDRVRELNDVRVTTGLVRRLRDTLPRTLLTINGRITYEAAERGNIELVKRHVHTIQNAGYNDGLPTEVLRESLVPVRLRLKALCEAAASKADKDPDHANTVTWGLLKESKTLLSIIDMVLPEADPIRQGLHDSVASTAMGCQISYGNKTLNWKESLKLLEATLLVAAGQAMRERIELNVDIVKKNQEVGRCYFCGENQSSDKNVVDVPIWGNLKKMSSGYNSYQVTWNHGSIKVPRCPSCASHHSSSATKSFLLGTGIFVLAIIIGLIACPDAVIVLAGGGLVVGIAAGVFLHSSLCKQAGIKTLSTSSSHSVVQEQLRQGWHLGSGPSDEQKRNAPLSYGGIDDLLGRLRL